MQKYISITAVLLLLFIVPFGSWYYLKKGLDYRKDALKELLGKDSLSAQLDTLDYLNGKTSIIVLENSSKLLKVVTTIDEQFKNTPKFQIVYVDSFLNDTKLILPKDYIAAFISKYQGKSFLLLDEKMILRNTYNADETSIKKLIEHTAIVLPRPKEADIKSKSN